MKIGFIGLGNVGGKLAGSLLRNGYELTVRDLNREIVSPFLEGGIFTVNKPFLSSISFLFFILLI